MTNQRVSKEQQRGKVGFNLLTPKELSVWARVPAAFFASIFLHSLVVVGFKTIPVVQEKPKVIQKVTIRDQPKPVVPPVEPVVEKKAPPKPPPVDEVKKRKPRVREDKRMKPPEPQPEAPPPEIRGGLTDSTALNGKASSIGIAEGNSAEAVVDPSKADSPPPPPVAKEAPFDPDASPVSEASADVVAQCSRLSSDISITDDAAYAGLTSGRVIVDVVINSKGEVSSAKLVERTGYDVDKVVLEAVKKLRCTPAKKNGVDVAQKRRYEIPITQ